MKIIIITKRLYLWTVVITLALFLFQNGGRRGILLLHVFSDYTKVQDVAYTVAAVVLYVSVAIEL